MKLFRFMSKKEFDKLIKGEVLTNNKEHKGHTNSKGFCFMDVEDNSPEYAYEFLSGIVSDDVCVVFETDKKLKKSYGVYADPYGRFFDTITENEYCTKKYSLKDFKIVEMAIPVFSLDEKEQEWEWTSNVNEMSKKLQEIQKAREKERRTRLKIQKCRDEYEENQSKILLNFCKEVNEKHKIEIKIGDKYYKLPCSIESMDNEPRTIEGIPVANDLQIIFRTWIR